MSHMFKISLLKDLKLIIFICLLYALYIMCIVAWANIEASNKQYFLEAGLLVALRTSTIVDYLKCCIPINVILKNKQTLLSTVFWKWIDNKLILKCILCKTFCLFLFEDARVTTMLLIFIMFITITCMFRISYEKIPENYVLRFNKAYT